MRILLFLIVIAGLIGCSEDFLERTNPSTMSLDNFYETKSDFDMALAGVYNVLLRSDNYNMSFWEHFMISSDDAHPGDDAEFGSLYGNDIDNFTVRPDNIIPLNIFSSNYIGIARANTVISRIKDVDLEKSYKDMVIAECSFLRALYYFNLVRTFGDVPLITREVNDPELVNVPRTDKLKIYTELIVPDLKDAASLLPETRDNTTHGRATSGAAKALLVKVYLTLAQYDASYFTLAKTLAEEIITSGVYELEPDFADIFKRENEFGKESIFEINHKSGQDFYYFEGFGQGNHQPKRIGVGSFYNLAFSPRFKGPSKAGDSLGAFSFSGWGFAVPTTESDPRSEILSVPEGTGIVEQYQDGDMRKDVSILSYYDAAEELNIPVDHSISPYNIKKYDDWEESVNGEADDNFMLLRLADVYLMYAEADNEVNNGPTDKAYEYINIVRRRAFGYPLNQPSPVDLSGLSYDEFLKAVYLERRLELAFEGHRWFDLARRPEMAIETMKKQGKTAINKDKLILPIPQYVIDESDGLITQNEGYN
ncbi:MAG: RagB/SusD family nutrient uptake outer membrane protein [Bacteroidota bacterium]